MVEKCAFVITLLLSHFLVLWKSFGVVNRMQKPYLYLWLRNEDTRTVISQQNGFNNTGNWTRQIDTFNMILKLAYSMSL